MRYIRYPDSTDVLTLPVTKGSLHTFPHGVEGYRLSLSHLLIRTLGYVVLNLESNTSGRVVIMKHGSRHPNCLKVRIQGVLKGGGGVHGNPLGGGVHRADNLTLDGEEGVRGTEETGDVLQI